MTDHQSLGNDYADIIRAAGLNGVRCATLKNARSKKSDAQREIEDREAANGRRTYNYGQDESVGLYTTTSGPPIKPSTTTIMVQGVLRP